jgi:UDPglucose--hexose-1-phosphate uridylyltransferase
MPELRKDPVTGRWVIIATERVRRPRDLARQAPAPRGGPCAFCAGHEAETPPEIAVYGDGRRGADGAGWRVRVVPNKFPALRIEGDLTRRGEGLYDRMAGVGAHEVVIESPRHDDDLTTLSPAALVDVVRAFRDRIADLRNDPRFRFVLVFRNRGAEAGASLEHPHSQLIATPVVPRTVNDEIDSAAAYYRWRERCLFCDILSQETEARVRIVAETHGVVALAPYAARFPFETWFLPRAHGAAFEQADDAVLADLAQTLGAVLRKLDRATGVPPYNLLVHSAPFGTADSPSYHWHFELLPKLTSVAGFELGSGFHINPVPPEDAARFLRDTPGD